MPWRIPLPSSNYLEGLDQTVGSAMDSRKQMQQFMLQNQLAQEKEQREKDLSQAEIKQKTSMSNYYDRSPGAGMAGGGVNLKDQMALMQQVIKDKPGTTLEQANQITNAWLSGQQTLPDGSPAPEPQGNALYLLDTMGRRRTTSPVITQGIQANQAEAEMPVLNKYINEGVEPYGTTVFGKSPQQIKDSLNINNKDAQTRLGNYIASQQLLYDRSALMLKMTGLPPGVTLADEAKKLASQTIDAKYPTLSAQARRIASDRVAQAITEVMEARRKVPVGASSITSRKNNNETPKIEEKIIGNVTYHKVNGQWRPLVKGK